MNIALVVTGEGMPLGYEVLAGNRTDVTTVEEIVETMEGRYGKAKRIWVMDRGRASRKNLACYAKDDGPSRRLDRHGCVRCCKTVQSTLRADPLRAEKANANAPASGKALAPLTAS